MVNKAVQNSARAEQLQFLRFLAFLNVFISHAEVWNFFGYPASYSARFAVSFFFSLSGLVTGYSGYGKEIRLGVREMGKYMGKKLWKVYPLYFLTMTIPMLNAGIPELIASGNYEVLREALVQLGKNLLLIQAWFTEGFFSINGVGWFLSALMFLNLFNLPMLYLLNKVEKSHYRKLLLGGGFWAVALAAVFYCGITRSLNRSYYHYIFPPARLGEYLLGMILGFVLRPLTVGMGKNRKNVHFFTL